MIFLDISKDRGYIMITMDIIGEVRKKSREEWLAGYFKSLETVRTWIQTNGEKSLFVGVIAGILTILAFQLLIFLLILTAIVMFAVWYTAKPSNTNQ